ncbi:MAG: hypothetical protein JJE30_06490 [Desulfuromonadales bacterium]|nr:hypothetical protein [Desulfuromonadales bacterium]
MVTVEQLNDIIAKGEQLDVEFKSDRHTMDSYGLADEEIAVVEGKK